MTASSRKFRLSFLAVLGVLVLALVPAAIAGKGGGGAKPSGGGGGSGSLSLVMVTDAGTPGVSYGDTITFNVSTSASFPSVQLACYQNGTLAYTSTRGFYPTYMWSDNYLLEGGYWSGGAANCTATLYTTSTTPESSSSASTTLRKPASSRRP